MGDVDGLMYKQNVPSGCQDPASLELLFSWVEDLVEWERSCRLAWEGRKLKVVASFTSEERQAPRRGQQGREGE